MTENELIHFGIKGMKWGVRRYRNKDGSLTSAGKKRYAENYTAQQRTRDRKLYGSKAVKRINNRMLKGESVQSARHNEVVRKNRINKGKRLTATVATSAVVLGGAAATAALMKKSNIFSQLPVSELNEQIVKIGKSVVSGLFRR